MQKSKIPWCTHTWNPSAGCPPPLASIGCANCYARELHNTRHIAYMAGKKLPKQYAYPFEVMQLFPDRLDDPLHCRAKDAKIFVGSMTDLFHPKVPDKFIGDVFDVIRKTPQHTYQILTKRTERMAEFANMLLHAEVNGAKHLKHVWWGGSISTQADADRHVLNIMNIKDAAVRFVSIEPMLERIDISKFEEEEWKCNGCGEFYAHFQDYSCNHCGYAERDSEYRNQLDWVIIGCESGPGARLCSNDDIRYVNKQCRDAGVPFFNKQVIVNNKCNKNPEQWPEDLRVQKYPKK